MVVEAVQRATELEPELTLSRAMEGRALLLAGRADECVGLELGPHEGVRAACLWALGRRDEAMVIVDSLEATVGGRAGSSRAPLRDVRKSPRRSGRRAARGRLGGGDLAAGPAATGGVCGAVGPALSWAGISPRDKLGSLCVFRVAWTVSWRRSGMTAGALLRRRYLGLDDG